MRFLPLLWLLVVLSACSSFGPNNSPYLVYFQERSAQLDAPARSLIAEAAQRANADPTAPVTVAGYTDSAGSPPADVLLSQQRAQAVADALSADGVAANRLIRKGRGQTGGDPGHCKPAGRNYDRWRLNEADCANRWPGRLSSRRPPERWVTANRYLVWAADMAGSAARAACVPRSTLRLLPRSQSP